MHIPRALSGWTDMPNVSLHGVPNVPRQRDLLNIAWQSRVIARPSTPIDISKHNVWVDLSQSVLRRPWGDRLRAFRSRSHIYSYEQDRCLSGTDQLRVNGYPHRYLEGISQVDQLQLSEFATSVPMVCPTQIVLWCNPYGDWQRPDQ